MEEYEAIIKSLINGQLRQALNQVNNYTWVRFITTLELDEDFTDNVKLVWLCKLVRTRSYYECC
jgi:hypothetical protein